MVAVCIKKGALPTAFGLGEANHRQHRRHRLLERFVTCASSVVDKGLCSRWSGTGVPRLACRWKRRDVVPLGTGIQWLRKGERGRILCSRQGGTDIVRQRWALGMDEVGKKSRR